MPGIMAAGDGFDSFSANITIVTYFFPLLASASGLLLKGRKMVFLRSLFLEYFCVADMKIINSPVTEVNHLVNTREYI